jgi:hypothetical protein
VIKSRELAILWLSVVCLAAAPVHARFWSLDLSSLANHGYLDGFEGKEPGPGDEEQIRSLKNLPIGNVEFRGIPFRVLDPAQNSGHSFLVLKGKALPQYPQGLAIPFGNQTAEELYFLQECRWASTGLDYKVGAYEVVYADSSVETIPLRVGRELVNFWGADDTAESFLAWWHQDRGVETGLNLLAWPNPKPKVPIQTLLFLSEGRAPVPMLYAVTASDSQVPVTASSPKPEKTSTTDTTGWFQVQAGLPDFRGTPLDLTAPLQGPVSVRTNSYWGWESIQDKTATPTLLTPVPTPTDSIAATQWGDAGDQVSISTAPMTFSDQPWVLTPESSLSLQLINQRSWNQPFGVRWSANWPNEYVAGLPLWMAAQQCLQGWSACVGKGEPGTDVSTLPDPNSFIGNPLISSQWPLAALVVIRDDLKEGKTFVLPPLSQGQTLGLETALVAQAHQSGLESKGFQTDISGKLKAKIEPKTKTFVSDTGQLTWQGNVGVVKIESPRFQALMGFLAHRKFNNNTWALETPNKYASFALASLTSKVIISSDHILISAVSRCENTGMVYNQKKTKVLDPGKAPVLMEPIQAKFVLYRYRKDLKLKVRALDQNGKPMKVSISTRWVGDNLVLSWKSGIFYLEIFK